MAFVRDAPVGTYVAIPMRIHDVQARYTHASQEPYLRVHGGDAEGDAAGPLRLEVVNDRAYDSARGMWMRSASASKTIECNVWTACEDVGDVESITQFF